MKALIVRQDGDINTDELRRGTKLEDATAHQYNRFCTICALNGCAADFCEGFRKTTYVTAGPLDVVHSVIH